jgi:branched-subunit amino acid ABC-type transport system permease component
MLLERVFLRPMVGEELFAVAIVTLGMDIVIRNITNDFIGTDPRPLGDSLRDRIGRTRLGLDRQDTRSSRSPLPSSWSFSSPSSSGHGPGSQ